MIGKKKLSTIREEVERGLGSTGKDAIQWLEEQIAAAKRKSEGTEVLEGLQDFLKRPRKVKRQMQKVKAKK